MEKGRTLSIPAVADRFLMPKSCLPTLDAVRHYSEVEEIAFTSFLLFQE